MADTAEVIETREWVEWRLDHEANDPGARQWMTGAVERMGKDNLVDTYVLLRNLSGTYMIDLRRRPWAGDPELKAMARAVRDAVGNLSSELYATIWGRR